jgi:hypothetical protein
MLINGYSFNNTINANPGAGPPSPQDVRNSTLRKQIVNENRQAIECILSMTLAYEYTWKRGDPLIVGHLAKVH